MSCSACGCIQHNLYPKVVEQSSYENTYTLSHAKQAIAKSLGRSSHKDTINA